MNLNKYLITGNEAVAKASLKAGLGFFAGYPITPASEIMQILAKTEKLKFVHAEDEIASMHMCIGASLAGKKVMTATSGPGFSLMQEAIGAGHILEIPMVIVNCQRVGPGTGMPTLPHQGDVLQTQHGAHGDYYPIVFAPNSVEECYKYTIEAFNAAEESQSPVILLSDAFLSRLYETVSLGAEIKNKERKRAPFGEQTRHFTALLNDNGALKTRDSEFYKKWIKQIKEKMKKTAENYEYYEYLENKKSKTLLISYGIISRVLYELKDKYAIFRPIRLFPVIEKIKGIADKYERIVVIEMNNGQYVKEIEQVLKRPVQLISQLGGRINVKEIKQGLEQ